ncbi:ABC transporter ATP-binding protein [Pseudomonas syringae]|nr:ABC transporter ATP-binding protein [Pseudomonas syringae]MCQ3032866.1 ABC transporter ATP-binding protein [Pseudomonas syringae]
MSSEVAIKIENLSKCYHIYDKPRDRLFQMLSGARKTYYKEFWAVRDASFQVYKGETVGIVGRNGSGKSTLLQMICGTLNPTSGSLEVSGRIAALLELGSGFNPEFTGRENVYLNAAVLGLSKAQIDERYDEILEFSEIGEFIHQAVKTYSSGMLVRLAFSVAINTDPQILIVDEALSVGDELFQRKCYARIEAIKKTGATILFVSHSGAAITELCDRAVLMDAGQKLVEGTPKRVVGLYQRLLYATVDKRAAIREAIASGDTELETLSKVNEGDSEVLSSVDEYFDEGLAPTSTIEYETNGARIHNVRIEKQDGGRVNNLTQLTRYQYRYSVTFDQSMTNVRFGMLIKTTSGVEVGGSHTANLTPNGIPLVHAGQTCEVVFDFDCLVNPGVYFMNAGVTACKDAEEVFAHRILDVLMFRVLPRPQNLGTAIVNLNFSSRVEFSE